MTSNIKWILGDLTDQIKKGIVVKLSGGADSSILYYALCKEIADNNLNIPVYVITLGTDCKPVYPFLARKVIHFTGLATGIWPVEHISYHEKRHTADLLTQVDSPEWKYGDDIYSAMQDYIWWPLILDNKVDALLGGLTENPPKEKMLSYLLSVADELNLDIDNIKDYCEHGNDPSRNNHKKKNAIDHITQDLCWESHMQYEEIIFRSEIERNNEFKKPKDSELDEKILIFHPFIHFDKRKTAEKYKEYDVLETLFPLTSSCEENNLSQRKKINEIEWDACGKCWFCYERIYGFGRL